MMKNRLNDSQNDILDDLHLVLRKNDVGMCECDEVPYTYSKKGDYDKGLPKFVYCSVCHGRVYIHRSKEKIK